MYSNIRNSLLLRYVTAIILCAGFVSCSIEDFDIENKETLPAGKYPLQFTATVGQMKTRAYGKEDWKTGDTIGVHIGNYEEIGRYALNASGSVKQIIDSTSWKNKEPADIVGWFPFKAQKGLSIANQSKGYAAFNFMKAKAENQSYEHKCELEFKHLMSKLTCILVQGDGISDEEFATVQWQAKGLTLVTFSETEFSATQNGWIDHDSDNEMLLVPQLMAGEEFIKVTLTVNVNGIKLPKTYIYRPPLTDDLLKEGMHYTYTITVKKDRIVVSSLSASWDDEEGSNIATPIFHYVNFPKVEGLNPDFSEEVIAIDDMPVTRDGEEYVRLTINGKKFSFTYPETESNKMLGYNLAPNTDSSTSIYRLVNNEDADDSGDYQYTVHLSTLETNITYGDYIQEGDFFYSDGTWSTSLSAEKNCVGIVYKAGCDGVVDDLSNYPVEEGEAPWRQIMGYVLALEDASSGVKWATLGGNLNFTGSEVYSDRDYLNQPDRFNGYTTTQSCVNYNADRYLACTGAANYMSDVKIENSSGWYLPTIWQMLAARHAWSSGSSFLPNLRTKGKVLALGIYWTSTICSQRNVWVLSCMTEAQTNAVGTTYSYRTRPGLTILRK